MNNDKRFCPVCGNELPAGWKFCSQTCRGVNLGAVRRRMHFENFPDLGAYRKPYSKPKTQEV